jgi:hypothetical protein
MSYSRVTHSAWLLHAPGGDPHGTCTHRRPMFSFLRSGGPQRVRSHGSQGQCRARSRRAGPPATCSRPLRVAGWTAPIVLRIISVGHPLPHVPCYIIGAIRALAGLIAPDWGRRAIAVIDRSIFPCEGTVAVAEIGLRAVDLIAPRIQASIRAAGGFFPLGFGGQTLAGPGAVLFGIVPAHLYDWMGLPLGNTTPVTSRSTPVGVGHLGPCLRSSAALAPTLAFCLRAIACGLDKLLEAGVRHLVFVGIESV